MAALLGTLAGAGLFAVAPTVLLLNGFTGVLVADTAAVLATLPDGRSCRGCVYAFGIGLPIKLCLKGELDLCCKRLLLAMLLLQHKILLRHSCMRCSSSWCQSHQQWFSNAKNANACVIARQKSFFSGGTTLALRRLLGLLIPLASADHGSRGRVSAAALPVNVMT